MNYKEDLGSDNKGTEGGNITMESETGQENSKKTCNPTLRQKTNKRVHQFSISQVIDHQLDKGKPLNHCQMIFYGNRNSTCR